MPVLPDKLYEVLKWLTLIAIPALTTFYVVCAGIWGWPMADEVAKTSAAVCVLIGTLIGISQISYNKALSITGEDAKTEKKAKKEEKKEAEG